MVDAITLRVETIASYVLLPKCSLFVEKTLENRENVTYSGSTSLAKKVAFDKIMPGG